MQQRNKGLQALVVVTIMLVAAATIFADAASAAPGDTVVPVPPNPAGASDPCGPNNASWFLPANADTNQFDFRIEGNDHLTVTDITGVEAFPAGPNTSNQDHTYDYGLAPDSGVTCPSNVLVTPSPPVETVPSCGNPVKTITPSTQAGVVWNPSGATNLKPGQSNFYTASAAQGYEIAAGAQDSFVFANGFDTSTCGGGTTFIPVPPRPSVTDPCNPAGVTDNATWNKPADSAKFSWAIGDGTDVPKGVLEVTINPTGVAFPDHKTYHDYGLAPDSGVSCPPAVYAPHGKIIVNCNTRVSYVMDNRGSNRTVLYTAAWRYGKTTVVKRVSIKAHSKVTVTVYRVHRSARATLVARSRLLASVAHVTYRRC